VPNKQIWSRRAAVFLSGLGLAHGLRRDPSRFRKRGGVWWIRMGPGQRIFFRNFDTGEWSEISN
jgi:hypothetical protein